MDSNHVTVVYKWTAQPGKLDELAAIYRDVTDAMEQNEPGAEAVHVYVSETDNALYVRDEFADANSGAVEHLEHGAVAQAEGRRGIDGCDQRRGLVGPQRARQPLVAARHRHALRRHVLNTNPQSSPHHAARDASHARLPRSTLASHQLETTGNGTSFRVTSGPTQ